MAVHPDRGILKKTFSQFDYYTLQRCRAAWKCFLEWKRAVEVEANHSPLKPGMKLKIEWRGVEKRYTLWRAELDVYHQQIPEESSGIATQYTRPKDNPLKGCIEGNSSELWFDVAEARKIGPRRFSQILFGRICGKGPLLCLKLFDERHFPYPDDSDNPDAPKVDWGAPPSQRLLDLHFAVDMVRREESAFDRLKDFQGSLIPHFFGNHFFTLANDWVFPGVLMEVIEGPVFGECDVDGWTTEEQRSFVTHVRHGLRVLKFAGIEQTDWHEGQIMCPLNSFGQRHAVFMDFAFANQRLGEHKGKPVTDDAEWLKLLLTDCGIDEEVMKECWFDLVDEER
ncbi:hypothetical protein GLOTRDRAFT_132646 [Gloeophyllum trabeum ATCC 11539]|uniref:Uncharacterized protein n=1 Tax=Gloeophyllum trabeum (strain ATCC 11539 / FP-39264 / Madison 617) TaxID=670483 RepID=S7RC69_GLOTA|nr:uncharacterized protein GLOTRDRAFT_132646 [Gloeophyllum trabeum ATCC 11539]EPQ51835.1 hypothetical protein GLOTRDRAFT_132646 [Gloeophyllum trabeum ATCC 11539]